MFQVPKARVDPKGIESTIRMRRGSDPRTVKGELIEVRETGFLVLSAATNELMLLPYSRIVHMRFASKVGISRSVSGSSLKTLNVGPIQVDRQRQRVLALFSRYPFGLDEPQLRRVLDSLGQTEVVVIGI